MTTGDDSGHERRWRRRTVRMLVHYVSSRGGARERATTLGAGGLFIETHDPLPRGARLKVRFQLPGAGFVHEIEGRVAWAHVPRPDETHSPGMGIEFTDAVATAKLARQLEALPETPAD